MRFRCRAKPLELFDLGRRTALDPTHHKRFVIGVDRSKMRLFDVDEDGQTLTDDTPVFDNTETGKRFEDFKL